MSQIRFFRWNNSIEYSRPDQAIISMLLSLRFLIRSLHRSLHCSLHDHLGRFNANSISSIDSAYLFFSHCELQMYFQIETFYVTTSAFCGSFIGI